MIDSLEPCPDCGSMKHKSCNRLTNQLKGSLALMPKGTKAPTDAKSVYVKFTTPEDLDLYDSLVAGANANRRDLGTYILLELLDNRPKQTSAKL